MSTQLIGFSVGGICKRILVAPASMIWPENLAYCALFNMLHTQETMGTRGRRGIFRERFLTYVFIGYFFYSQLSSSFSLTLLLIRFILDFLPSYLFTALSTFSWVCWIAPNDVKVNQIFGVTHDLGMGLITFDLVAHPDKKRSSRSTQSRERGTTCLGEPLNGANRLAVVATRAVTKRCTATAESDTYDFHLKYEDPMKYILGQFLASKLTRPATKPRFE